jgi:diguanylate cyclase (GGDEF)-like protein
VDSPSLAFSLSSDGRLLLLAVAVAAAASFVSISIFGYASHGRANRRAGWLLLAAVCSAFGLWAAHFIALLSDRSELPGAFEGMLTVAALVSIAGTMWCGFAVAAKGARWDAPIGGAINGAGMGIMHYLGLYALAAPGMLEWDLPLALATFGLGVGLNSAALTVYQRRKGLAATWLATGLVTLAFLSLHLTQAEHVVSRAEAAMSAGGPLHWILAAVAAGAVLVVLLLGAAAMLIDRQTMRDNVQIMQQLVDTAIEGIVVARNDRIFSVNQGIAELCGVARSELIGKSVIGNLIDKPIAASGEALLRTAASASVPVSVAHKRLSTGDDVYAIHDLTERRAVELELQRQNKALQEREEELKSRNLLLDTALLHMSQGLCMYDKDQRVVVCNERYATLYGLTPEDVKPGSTRREIVERRVALGVWGGESAETYLLDRTAAIDATSYSVQEMNDGRSIATAHVPMPGGGWVCTHEDITERRQAQAKIEHLARHDVLTNLPNRVLVREQLQEALARLRSGEGLAVHCIDLDRFKEINDALGHAIGDELLQAVATRLSEVVGGADTLARMGGDEYVIVQNPAFSPTDATDLARQIIARMNEPFRLAQRFQVVIGVSIGIAMAPADGTDAGQLLKDANLALYRAKEEERGRYRFFEKEMDARMRARHELEHNLRNALANGELDLDYQPLMNLKRNQLSGFEALMRWRTPQGTEIPPSEFIPLAEETGLIVPMGEWALRQALAQAAKWPRHIRVAVNLSPVQFNSRNLTQLVMSALASSGVEASRLELEITESVLLQNRETTRVTLHQLRDLGVRIALDDFGTGFSSLSYLRSFPFDKIKIDQSFIAGLADGNEESLAIVRAVARLGASLGVATTAEGVETQLQFNIARREGFTEAQGFWIGRPKSAAAIAEEGDLSRARKAKRRPAAGEADISKIVERPVEPKIQVDGAPRRARRTRRARSA